jgi:G3E family GTPase
VTFVPAQKVAVMVNDMAAINVDAELVARDRYVRVAEQRERIVSLSNGCVCCTLREDLLEQVVELAQTGEFEYLLIGAA